MPYCRCFPTSLPEFQRVFPDDTACARYLETIRWPNGFVCPKCGEAAEPYRFPTRSSVVLRCRKCKANTSLTAGTVMQSSHTPLSTWFWGAYLMTTETPGQSAVQFQRQLGLSRYETAFQVLHKLRAVMVRPERDTITRSARTILSRSMSVLLAVRRVEKDAVFTTNLLSWEPLRFDLVAKMERSTDGKFTQVG